MDLTTLWNTLSANPLAVAIIGIVLGALLTQFLPWLSRQVQRFGGALLAFISGRGHDYEFERRYLNWLINRHGYLGLLPSNVAVQLHGQKGTLELEQVFVDLAFTSGGTVETGSLQPEQKMSERLLMIRKPRGWRGYLPKRFWPKPKRQNELGRVVENNLRLVVRGDPGSGKTTLMKYLAVSCARARRNLPREGDKPNLVRQRLGWNKRPFPIYVSLGKQGGVTAWDKDHVLSDSFGDEFTGELPDAPKQFFERRLKRGNCLVLLDAFDEIGSREGRNAMARYVAGLFNTSWHPTNHIVVTTRIAGYEGQLDAQGFAVQTVQPLTREQMERLVHLRYAAIALNEGLNQSPERQKMVQSDYARRAERLLGELTKNSQLRELGVNPLLLSLIVLVHSVKVELPEERHILYRDCVEILTQNWRQAKREALAVTTTKEELNLPQKISLLQNIAVTMQMQRTNAIEGQVPLLRRNVEILIANQLPNLLTTPLPDNPQARYALCAEKASEWLEGIKLESGILEEFGFDRVTGEPLVRFSHLTFQEYLAAQALTEMPGDVTALNNNLLNAVWEEVLLLYMAMSPAGRANEYTQRLLKLSTREYPRGIGVVGRALREKILLPEKTRHEILNGLHDALYCPDPAYRKRSCELLESVGTQESAELLVQVLEADTEFQVRYAAGLALGRLGDPRFERIEPEMVDVPAGEFMMSNGSWSGRPMEAVTLPAYYIGKYPITNCNYKHFLDETGYQAPFDWEGTEYPEGQMNHPVGNVSWNDAGAYCEWLTRKTGSVYRLPTEVEWEKAARGTDARVYPWGNEFSKEKCNSKESGIGTTTPVGIYIDGASPYGALDMSGNVLEWCSSSSRSSLLGNYGTQTLDRIRSAGLNLLLRLFQPGRQSDTEVRRVLRGGAFRFDQNFARCFYATDFNPELRVDFFGFRVAKPVLP